MTAPRNPAAATGQPTAPHQVPPQRIAGDDPLEQTSCHAAADAAGAEALLRCWVRETSASPPGEPVRVPGAAGGPDEAVLRVPLPATGITLRVPVRHWSAVGTHRFGPPLVEPGRGGAPASPIPLDAVTLAALLAREASAGRSAAPEPGGTPAGQEPRPARAPAVRPPAGQGVADRADVVTRVADSVRRTTLFLEERRARPQAPAGTGPFLDAEQSLVLGHPLHPAPKSREGLSDAETRWYSPETRGSFPLHWLAVHRDVLAADSAWTESGRPLPADRLTARLAGDRLPVPDGMAVLPLHPWQARAALDRPAVRELLEAGLLRDLGPAGPSWYPTSSVRTVYRPGAEAMLKLSLGLRITNSRRENLRKELQRGVEVHRLLRGGVGGRWRAACPTFDIVRDPAWLAVNTPSGAPLSGLDVMLRHVPFGAGADVAVLAGLASPRPSPDRPVGELRSRLAEVTARLAARTGRPAAAVATEWFLRYLETVVRPVLWLDGQAGIALEAHQQNTLVMLDEHGWPSGGYYRDNQGYYFRASRRDALDRVLPGVGTLSDTFVADPVADERFAYYLGVNNVLGLIGSFGSQRLAEERVLLAAFRRFLTDPATVATGSSLPELLLRGPRLRCKANLLTRLSGLDELVGPVDGQSVYVTIANPVAVPSL